MNKIQGAVASSENSTGLEEIVNRALQKLEIEVKGHLTGEELKEVAGANFNERISGIRPDGGFLYKNGIPKIAIECKYNNIKGNAVERWFKNYLICRDVLKLDRYITFLMGDGFFDDHPPSRIVSIAGLLEGYSNSVYDLYPLKFAQFYRFRNLQEAEEQIEDILRAELRGYLK